MAGGTWRVVVMEIIGAGSPGRGALGLGRILPQHFLMGEQRHGLVAIRLIGMRVIRGAFEMGIAFRQSVVRGVEEGIALPMIVIAFGMIAVGMIHRGMIIMMMVIPLGVLMVMLFRRVLGAFFRGRFDPARAAAVTAAAFRPFLMLGFERRLGLADQRFAIGDRDPVIGGMDLAEGEEAMAVSDILHETDL